MRRTAALFVALLFLSPTVLAQEKEQGKKKKLKLDMEYKYDPFELQAYSQRFPQPKQLKGPLRVGDQYVPPAQDTGPYLGPPLRIYGNGFGTSLLRSGDRPPDHLVSFCLETG